MTKIDRITLHITDITPKTKWSFIAVETDDGACGWGEASLQGEEDAILAAATIWQARLFENADPTPRLLGAPADLAEAAVVSALDHALWDLAAQRGGQSMAALLGGAGSVPVPLYANINRRTRDRRPDGFAQSARDAAALGFTAFKIAPFDEVVPETRRAGGVAAAIALGMARAAAVREIVGPDCALMVDCHWRFEEAEALRVIDQAAELGLHWVECPLPETPDQFAALRRLRSAANARGVRLAGAELGIGEQGFAPFLAAGIYDAMMPDVKYVGGLQTVLRLAEMFAVAGVGFSPHNPSGPICHAVSLHICAAVPGSERLEVQFDESPLFETLAAGALPSMRGGASALPAARLGLGVALDEDILAQHAGLRRSWTRGY